MPRRSVLAVTLLLSVASAALAQAPQGQNPQGQPAPTFPATLAGHAVLPADSVEPLPADAPRDLATPGKFTTGRRVEAVGTVEAQSMGRTTTMKLPLRGQPLQGHSGIKHMPDGTYWVLTDNGFGTKANSPDAMLYLNRYRIDFAKGGVERVETIYLRDPDRKVPFRIANEATESRYLTGSDFDPESFQFVGDRIWIGEEFGPFLIEVDRSGKVQAVVETLAAGKPVRSPDNPAVTTPAMPGGAVAFNARRSKGFEGMAASPDGSRLYALLEGPLWDADAKAFETRDGKEVLRILEFDTRARAWTGRSWFYPLEANGHAIGDFNLIDATTGLVIERDDGEGTSDKACPAGQKGPDCFSAPAAFKRVFKIEMTDANQGGAVRKIGSIDLMRIADPAGKARKPLTDGALAFPFLTIENVDKVDDTHIVVGNDNNLPFSASRDPHQVDDNEFVLLEVGDFLKAK
ncbi:glycerophosphodiester phosphodiesterase [Methylobacterium indicum]|uniref:esterase-like activity of phytase family protein n=1 Tax=Methylobacterium indicum TaxID=1775910 RepID=UPI000733E47C|nr:esterase-like activity of phytase family protein [Methylobacterium indicum]KTS22769.1 glycerophosphodiester phosphodiesterase [Methylobacterium indicum]KTS42137.1 glycerophosphodiester phosphodiesterase [Methylobacterium indicum]KTS52563.1 glycerophosphodiester phosphodiesterase [Methylobacterium indicum]